MIKLQISTDEIVSLGNELVTTPPALEGTVYNICGKEYPVKLYYNIRGAEIPLVDIPMMSDFKWQYDCLMDRINNPNKYSIYCDENVEQNIEQLKQWLRDHIEGACELEESKRMKLLSLLYDEVKTA